MGQYHVLVNYDKKEVVVPHGLGLGLKQYEHTGEYNGTLADATEAQGLQGVLLTLRAFDLAARLGDDDLAHGSFTEASVEARFIR